MIIWFDTPNIYKYRRNIVSLPTSADQRAGGGGGGGSVFIGLPAGGSIDKHTRLDYIDISAPVSSSHSQPKSI